MVNHPNRKVKNGPLRTYLVYVDGHFRARLQAYTAKSARHEAKRRWPDRDVRVEEV